MWRYVTVIIMSLRLANLITVAEGLRPSSGVSLELLTLASCCMRAAEL